MESDTKRKGGSEVEKRAELKKVDQEGISRPTVIQHVGKVPENATKAVVRDKVKFTIKSPYLINRSVN